MIAIATITSNVDGDVVIYENPDSDFDTAEVRVSRTATLDKGSVIDVQGYSDGDRTLQVAAEMTEADADKLFDIFKDGNFVNVAIPEGMFRGVISRLTLDDGDVSFSIMISERLST